MYVWWHHTWLHPCKDSFSPGVCRKHVIFMRLWHFACLHLVVGRGGSSSIEMQANRTMCRGSLTARCIRTNCELVGVHASASKVNPRWDDRLQLSQPSKLCFESMWMIGSVKTFENLYQKIKHSCSYQIHMASGRAVQKYSSKLSVPHKLCLDYIHCPYCAL